MEEVYYTRNIETGLVKGDVCMGEITVEEKLNLLAGQMYMAAGIGTWGFGEEGELFYSTSANQDEFLAFLKWELPV